MGLSSVTGVLSRYFIVGFFVPAYVALFALSHALSPAWTPDAYASLAADTQVLVLGAAALVVGMVLVGLNFQLVQLFEGYALWTTPPLRPARNLFVSRQRARRRRIEALGNLAGPRWTLQRELPREDRLLPTAFGNRIRAAEDATKVRWGLDHIAIWPLVDGLLGPREQDLHTDVKSDLAFAMNAVLGAWIGGVVLLADALDNRDMTWGLALALALPFVGGYLIYRLLAIDAAERFGVEMRASVDLHRLDLYRALGYELPASEQAERSLALAISQALLYGRSMPRQGTGGELHDPEGGNRP